MSDKTKQGQQELSGSLEEREAALIASLCPGIRGAVAVLRHYGFDTCDSGDGSHAKAGMEGAFDVPMVAIRVTPMSMILEATRCANLLARFDIPPVAVQVTYSPADGIPLIIIVHEKLVDVAPCESCGALDHQEHEEASHYGR